MARRFAAQPHAIFLAELYVEQHEIDTRTLERALHAAAARGRGDAKPMGFQVTGERVACLAVFIDDENVFLCSHRTFRPIATSDAKSSMLVGGYVS